MSIFCRFISILKKVLPEYITFNTKSAVKNCYNQDCYYALLAAMIQRGYNILQKGGKNMLHENLKKFRKSKGLTQEELSARLNVVRQTISKWEKGLSVPDSDMLIRIAEILEVSVSELLGAPKKEKDQEPGITDIAEQLSRINEQLAIKNRRSRRVWKTIAVIVAAVILLNICLLIFCVIFSYVPSQTKNEQYEEQIAVFGDQTAKVT